MKEKYLLDLNDFYQKTSRKCQKLEVSNVPKSDQIDRVKKFSNLLERTIKFLNVARSNILPAVKDKLPAYEKQIIYILNSNKTRKPVSAQQEIQQPGDHSLSMQPQQQQEQQQQQQQQPDNQMNHQMQPTAVTNMHHGALPPLSNHMEGPSTVTIQFISNNMITLQDLEQHQKQEIEQQFQQCQMHQQWINQQMQHLLQQQQQLLRKQQQLLQQQQQLFRQQQQLPELQQQQIPQQQQNQQQVTQLQLQFQQQLLQQQSALLQAADKRQQLHHLNGGIFFPTTTTPQLFQVTTSLEIPQQHSFSSPQIHDQQQQQSLLPISFPKRKTAPLQSATSPSNIASASCRSTPLLMTPSCPIPGGPKEEEDP